MRLILFFIAVVQTFTLFVNGAPSLLAMTGAKNLGSPLEIKPSPPAAAGAGAGTGAEKQEILIHYKGQDQPDHIQYGQCIPFKKNGQAVQKAEFPTFVTCYGYMDAECTSLLPPLPAVFISQVKYVNFLELGSTVWGSYNCYDVANDPLSKKLLQPIPGVPKPDV